MEEKRMAAATRTCLGAPRSLRPMEAPKDDAEAEKASGEPEVALDQQQQQQKKGKSYGKMLINWKETWQNRTMHG